MFLSERAKRRCLERNKIMETQQKAHKKNILQGVRVEADLSGLLWPNVYHSEEARARGLEHAAEKFHDFLRDHRSQDMVALNIVRDFQDVCSACGDRWDTTDIDGVCCCGNCGAEVKE